VLAVLRSDKRRLAVCKASGWSRAGSE